MNLVLLVTFNWQRIYLLSWPIGLIRASALFDDSFVPPSVGNPCVTTSLLNIFLLCTAMTTWSVTAIAGWTQIKSTGLRSKAVASNPWISEYDNLRSLTISARCLSSNFWVFAPLEHLHPISTTFVLESDICIHSLLMPIIRNTISHNYQDPFKLSGCGYASIRLVFMALVIENFRIYGLSHIR